jgi:3'-phosphoadenosine 5'-phosphosulfate sulfotransferase (PAPS reductase)/FAD synthetase
MLWGDDHSGVAVHAPNVIVQDAPVVVSYGGGRDSTAMLIEKWKRNQRVDAIVFANVGSEKRETYEYIRLFNRWLQSKGLPAITVVKYQPVEAPYHTLEGNMTLNATLPGAALNKHTCAMKFKIEPQNQWSRRWRPAREAWARGQKVRKLIGFECGETDRLKRADARAHSGKAGADLERKRFAYEMPLMEWGMDLDDCIAVIQDAGLPVPPKSSCYFCPFQKRHEVDSMTPEDRSRTMLIEISAEPYNTKVRGLWRDASITEYILANKLDFVPLEELGRTVVLNPACQKARTGETFRSPHVGPTLREQLEAAGHFVPRIVIDATDAEGTVYRESQREVPMDVEDAVHAEAIAAI